MRDLTISGIDEYVVDVATFNILTLRLSIGLTFPKLSLSSFYDLDALLLRFIPIYGHGRLGLVVNGNWLLMITYINNIFVMTQTLHRLDDPGEWKVKFEHFNRTFKLNYTGY